MKKYLLALIPLIILMLAANSFAQDKPVNPKKDAEAETDDQSNTDEMFKNPITKEEGKKIFDKLPEEKKKEIIKKWNELKKLPETERKKALENFYRLLNAELKMIDKNDDEKTKPEKKEKEIYKHFKPEVMLANILHMSFYSFHQNRNEKYMHLIHSILKDDPNFFFKLRKINDEDERFKLLIKKREELFEKEINQIAKKIGLDDEKREALKKLLKKQREEEEKLDNKFVKEHVEIWNTAYKKVTENPKLAKILEKFLRISHVFGNQEKGPGFRKRQHRPDDKEFKERHSLEHWNSIVSKMKLDENRAKKLIDGYKTIYDKYAKSEDFSKYRKEFKNEMEKLLNEILTREEVQEFFKLLRPEPFRNHNEHGRKGPKQR